jgi:hypothetical protein
VGQSGSGGKQGAGQSQGGKQGGGQPGSAGNQGGASNSGPGGAPAAGGGGRGGPTTPGPGGPPSSPHGGEHYAPGAHTTQNPAHLLNPKFDPTKSPGYKKIFLGKPGTANKTGGKILPRSQWTRPEARGPSAVPTYGDTGQAKRADESAADKEDIPAAYRNNVKSYFESLQPRK